MLYFLNSLWHYQLNVSFPPMHCSTAVSSINLQHPHINISRFLNSLDRCLTKFNLISRFEAECILFLARSPKHLKSYSYYCFQELWITKFTSSKVACQILLHGLWNVYHKLISLVYHQYIQSVPELLNLQLCTVPSKYLATMQSQKIEASP